MNIDEYIALFGKENTKNTYKSMLNCFFLVNRKNPDTYFDTEQDYKADIIKFLDSIKTRPPKTRMVAKSVIRGYLEENEIELPRKFWLKDIPRKYGKGNSSTTDDIVSKPSEIKQILTHGDIKARSFFLILASSGVRIGELCQITLDDIFLDETPNRIHIRAEYTKGDTKRDVFISKEAGESLTEWMKHREIYLKLAVARCNFKHYKKDINDNRLFPLNDSTARGMWNRLLEKSGYNEKDKITGYYKRHAHTLRGFFRTYMPKGIGVDMTEALMGHTGYANYRKFQLSELREAYTKGMWAVSIFETPVSDDRIQKLETELETKDHQVKVLTEKLQSVEENQEQMEQKIQDYVEKEIGAILKATPTTDHPADYMTPELLGKGKRLDELQNTIRKKPEKK